MNDPDDTGQALYALQLQHEEEQMSHEPTMRTSPEINEIAAALAKAQGAIEGAKKGRENPHFRSKYADLASVWDACRDALSGNGLCVVQTTAPSERDEVVVITRMIHASGQWFEGVFPVPVSKADAQGYGSALTYARRYGLSAIVGIAPEDDDGNAASNAKPTRSEAARPLNAAELNKLQELRDAAINGTEALQVAWQAAGKDMRLRLADHLDSLKLAAAQAKVAA